MYVNRIRLVATEAGVGVRMLGEVATSGDDFTLTSAGKVEIQSHVSAARDLAITSTSASGSEDIHLNGADASLSASRNLNITTSAGQLKLTEGALYAGNNLGVTAASLIDASTGKTRVAEVDSSITVSGATSVNGSRWSANTGSLTLGLGSLSIGGSGATLGGMPG